MSKKELFIETLKLPFAIGLDLLGKKRLLKEVDSFNEEHKTDFTVDFKEDIVEESGRKTKITWNVVIESIKGGLVSSNKEKKVMSHKDHYRMYLESKRSLSC
jgi:hypothetical protein